MNDEGFIPLGRSFFAHYLWGEERVYSRAEAFLDLISEAAWKKRPKIVSGKSVEVPRGGIVASVRFLSDRWKWSNTKVCQFLDMLRQDGSITTEKRQGITVILLVNYERFNSLLSMEKKPEKRQQNDAETTPRRRGNDETEEGEQRKQTNTTPQAAAEGGEFLPREEVWRRVCPLVGRDPRKPKSPMEIAAFAGIEGVTDEDMTLVERYVAICRKEPAKYTRPKEVAHTFLTDIHTEIGKARRVLTVTIPASQKKAAELPPDWQKFLVAFAANFPERGDEIRAFKSVEQAQAAFKHIDIRAELKTWRAEQ